VNPAVGSARKRTPDVPRGSNDSDQAFVTKASLTATTKTLPASLRAEWERYSGMCLFEQEGAGGLVGCEVDGGYASYRRRRGRR
jgi:hypothetical protein